MKQLLFIFLVTFFSLSSLSQQSIDSLRVQIQNTSNPRERFGLLNQMIDVIFTKGSGNIDYATCVEMVELARELSDDSLLAIAYNTVGNYFLLNNGDYTQALEYFFKGIPLAEKANDKRRISSLYIDIAVTYYRMNNAEEQIRYLRKAMENLPDKNSPSYYFMLVQVQSYTCRYFIAKNQTDSALYYARSLQESNRHLKSQVYQSASEGLLGSIYSKRKDTLLARQHLLNALAIADSVQYSYIKLSARSHYIEYLIWQRELEEASIYNRQLMKMGRENNNPDIIRIAAGFARQIAAYKNQSDSAYHYALLELNMKDSVFNQQQLNKIQSLAFSEKLREMEEKARRKEEAEQRKHNIQYAVIAISIITFIIFFLLLNHSFKTNARMVRFLIVVALLLVFEFLNLLLHPLLGKITHHSPILMLLAMVGIAAFLIPFHHRLEHWALHVLIRKNKQVQEHQRPDK